MKKRMIAVMLAFSAVLGSLAMAGCAANTESGEPVEEKSGEVERLEIPDPEAVEVGSAE